MTGQEGHGPGWHNLKFNKKQHNIIFNQRELIMFTFHVNTFENF